MKNALITGIAGSGGSYLAEYLVREQPNVRVHGLCRWHSNSMVSPSNLNQLEGRITVHESDLMDFSSVFKAILKIQPDYVFHLASNANVRASFETPLSVMENNVMGTANLLEAVRLAGLNPIVHMCSSSEVYGDVEARLVPISEDTPLRPANPYAVSKATQDLMAYSYYLSYRMKIIRTRMFTYINPRRSDLFATSFAMQIARIEKGLQSELKHGNLDSARTFIDVRDAMESYWLAAEKCTPGEVYNIGGKTTKSVGEILEILKSKARVRVPTRLDHALLRPTDITRQIPDTSKFEKATGWKPRFSFDESIDMLLEHCRRAVASSRGLSEPAISIPPERFV